VQTSRGRVHECHECYTQARTDFGAYNRQTMQDTRQSWCPGRDAARQRQTTPFCSPLAAGIPLARRLLDAVAAAGTPMDSVRGDICKCIHTASKRLAAAPVRLAGLVVRAAKREKTRGTGSRHGNRMQLQGQCQAPTPRQDDKQAGSGSSSDTYVWFCKQGGRHKTARL
jgi:hypothetical protein